MGEKRMRTCIVCRKKAQKDELFRIVRKPDGGIAYDAGGNAAGRGAYICDAAHLRDKSFCGRVSHALKCRVDDTIRETLKEQIGGVDLREACGLLK
jgi:hypothetical protein